MAVVDSPDAAGPTGDGADVLDRLDPVVLPHIVNTLGWLKFSAALPERLAVATVAARLAALDSARSVLGESARFQHGG